MSSEANQMKRKVSQSRWSMRTDRELIELAKTQIILEVIAERLERSPTFVVNRAKKLGLTIKRIAP